MSRIYILQSVAYGKEAPTLYAAFTNVSDALALRDKCTEWVAARPATPACDYYNEDCNECDMRHASWVKAHAEWAAAAPLGTEVKMAWGFEIVSLSLNPEFGS